MAQELNIRLITDGKKPLYRQIYEYIRGEIRSGALEAGERLPSTRALASGLHVARSTAELAYSQLLSEGYIRAKKNSGYFVNEIENLAELHFEENRAGGADAGNEKREDYAAGQSRADLSESGLSVSGLSAADQRQKAEKAARVSAADPSVPSLSLLGKQGAANSAMIDFSLRHTEMSVFPYSTWKKIMREVMVDANSEMFSHSEPSGDLTLRTTIAHYLHFSRGVRCTPDQVIVGAGNDYLLMLLRHILGEGRRVAMENPSYLRAAQIFKSFGYEICPVRMDDDGMQPGSVAASGADLVYAMPAHQFPVGCIMPVGRRAALLGWATDAADRYIIEDDYDSEFRYRGKPIPALQSLDHAGRVIYIGTFSKVIAPAIRISYMILPPDLLTLYRRKCWFFSSTVSRIDQRILNEFMKNGHFERHLNRMRSLYRARHDELLAQLRPLQDRFRILGAGTGLHLVLQAAPGTAALIAQSMETGMYAEGESGDTETAQDLTKSTEGLSSARIEKEIVRRAAAHGVAVYAMSDYLLPETALKDGDDPDAESAGTRDDDSTKHLPAVLLGFGALDEVSIREGVRRLSRVLCFE